MKKVFGLQFTTRDGKVHFLRHGTMFRCQRNLLFAINRWPDAKITTYEVPTAADKAWAKLRGQPAPSLPPGVDEWFGV